MPSYGSHSPPSLRKMEYNSNNNNNNNVRHGSGRKFDLGNIVGDAFSLATISIALVSISSGTPLPAAEERADRVINRPAG